MPDNIVREGIRYVNIYSKAIEIAQQLLFDLDLYNGAIDGINGNKTKSAIKTLSTDSFLKIASLNANKLIIRAIGPLIIAIPAKLEGKNIGYINSSRNRFYSNSNSEYFNVLGYYDFMNKT